MIWADCTLQALVSKRAAKLPRTFLIVSYFLLSPSYGLARTVYFFLCNISFNRLYLYIIITINLDRALKEYSDNVQGCATTTNPDLRIREDLQDLKVNTISEVV